jgi:hypothetical protein
MLMKMSFFCTTHVLCQYRLYRVDHAYITYLMLQRQFSHLNGRRLEAVFSAWSVPKFFRISYKISTRTTQKISPLILQGGWYVPPRSNELYTDLKKHRFPYCCIFFYARYVYRSVPQQLMCF